MVRLRSGVVRSRSRPQEDGRTAPLPRRRLPLRILTVGQDCSVGKMVVSVEVADKPLRPRPAEVEFLIRRVEEQIARSKDVLPAAALEEYQEAMRAYRAAKGGG